jgi:predicted esterase
MMLLAAALLALAQPTQAPPAAQASPPATAAHQPRVIQLPNDAIAVVPASAGPHPPLLILLHGADHRPLWMLHQFADEADARGLVLLAPTSKDVTWDAVRNAEGLPSRDSPLANRLSHRFASSRDADRVEAAIAALEKILPVDRARTVLAGFSDGATFALAMGMSRGYAFSSVIAWSPGIAIRTANAARGRRVLVSHGRSDRTLNFGVTCGQIVPMLQSEGADVSFLPFDGTHEMPADVKDAFLDAAFGAIPGKLAHPLPANVERCASAKADVPMLGMR